MPFIPGKDDNQDFFNLIMDTFEDPDHARHARIVAEGMQGSQPDAVEEAYYGDVIKRMAQSSSMLKRLAYVVKEYPGEAEKVVGRSKETGKHSKAYLGPQPTGEKWLSALSSRAVVLLSRASKAAYDALVVTRYLAAGKLDRADALLKKNGV